jgi:hypothetical protein
MQAMRVSYASAPDITGHPLIRRLTALGLEADDFVIFGSAPLFVHGIRHTLGDLDVVARGKAWDRARQSGSPGKGTITGAEAAQFGEEGEEEISVFQNWISPCWDTHDLIGRAEIISGLRFAPLADVLAYKLMLQRPKDIADIQCILQSDVLAALNRSGLRFDPLSDMYPGTPMARRPGSYRTFRQAQFYRSRPMADTILR